MASTDLHTTAQQVLDAAKALLAQTAGGAIGRAFVSAGEPTPDCSQVTVHVALIGEASTVAPGPLAPGVRHRGGRLNLATLIITVYRCYDVPDDTPPASLLAAVSAITDEDAWILWTQLYRMQQAGELFALCDEVYFDGMAPLDEEGGFVGWTFTIRVEIPGYRQDPGS